MNRKIAAIVERMTGVPAAVTQKVADRITESGMLEPKKVQQQVNAARMIGKMAVQFGSKKLTPKTTKADTSDVNATVDNGESILSISDYSSRNALDITAQLNGLSGEQLAQIAAFESANRARRTILAKIEQLLAP